MKFRHQRALEEFRKKSGSYYDEVEDEVLFMIYFLPHFDINKYPVSRFLSDIVSLRIRGNTTIPSPYLIYRTKKNMLQIKSSAKRICYDYFPEERLIIFKKFGIMIKIKI